MRNTELLKKINEENDFFQKITKNRVWCNKYCFLLNYFLGSYDNQNKWGNEIFPLIELIKKDKSKIIDWGSFPWHGEVCFREDYIYFLDETIFFEGNSLKFLQDESGNSILDENNYIIIDTDFIKENYDAYLKIPINDFIEIGNLWINRFSDT